MNKISLGLILFAILFLVSCKKDFDPGTTNTAKMSNGWWCNFTLGGSDVYGLGYRFLSTYNTASNTDSIWVDDLENFWEFKCKAKFDPTTLTFSATNAPNEYYGITVNITDGKILPNAGHSLSGNKTDSIYMKVNFSDDPTNTYEIAGTARTGFVEDDH